MEENKHGFRVKQEFKMGGFLWTIIQTTERTVKCITSDIIGERAFDRRNDNDFAVSDLCEFLNDRFLEQVIGEGVPEDIFIPFTTDLTADDGQTKYGKGTFPISLITCDEYRKLRDRIPPANNSNYWWTVTADSPINPYVRCVGINGALRKNTLCENAASCERGGIRPVCVLSSSILKQYRDKAEEEAHRQERTSTIETIKRIVSAWSIQPKEIFGEDTNNDTI